MKPFDQLVEILVPNTGACVSIQGELLRAAAILEHEYRVQRMAIYYVRPDYRDLAAFVLDVLLANKGKIAGVDDLDAFASARRDLDTDFAVGARLARLQDLDFARKITRAQRRELAALERRDAVVDWADVLPRMKRCVEKWCLTHPVLVDLAGRPVREGGITDLRFVFEPLPRREERIVH